MHVLAAGPPQQSISKPLHEAVLSSVLPSTLALFFVLLFRWRCLSVGLLGGGVVPVLVKSNLSYAVFVIFTENGRHGKDNYFAEPL